MESLEELKKLYDAIIDQMDEPIKSKMLADLMSRLERTFNIPVVLNELWENENKEVLELYQKVSLSRVL